MAWHLFEFLTSQIKSTNINKCHSTKGKTAEQKISHYLITALLV